MLWGCFTTVVVNCAGRGGGAVIIVLTCSTSHTCQPIIIKHLFKPADYWHSLPERHVTFWDLNSLFSCCLNWACCCLQFFKLRGSLYRTLMAGMVCLNIVLDPHIKWRFFFVIRSLWLSQYLPCLCLPPWRVLLCYFVSSVFPPLVFLLYR